MMSAGSRVLSSQVMMPQRADPVVMSDFSEGKWPVWLRLVTIIGLSTALWAAIIWAAVSVFG
jgi:hypothetical protein